MAKEKISEIKEQITNSVVNLFSTENFTIFLKNNVIADGDWVTINNSFNLRKSIGLKTSKNSQYLTVPIKNGTPDLNNIFISKPKSFDNDFNLIKEVITKNIDSASLDNSIQGELNSLGELVFFLIGEIIDEQHSVSVNNKHIKILTFDSTAKESTIMKVDNDIVMIINQLVDPDLAWESIKACLPSYPTLDADSLENSFAQAYKTLKEEVRLYMKIPEATTKKSDNSFLDHLSKSVKEQVEEYESALNSYLSGFAKNDGYLKEIMRISYNFESDALKLLKLLVTLSDLKGIILWLTVDTHYRFAESIKNLPWTKRDGKASLSTYQEKIHGARNHAFHDFFLIDRTIEVDLTNINIVAHKLTLFPEYKNRAKPALQYQDKELVEAINELTRVSETVVNVDFWKSNLEVIKSFETLLKSTNEALWLLCEARGK